MKGSPGAGYDHLLVIGEISGEADDNITVLDAWHGDGINLLPRGPE